MKRRIFNILTIGLIIITVLLNFSSIKGSAKPYSKNHEEESSYLFDWFVLNGLGNHIISNPREMYSIDNNPIALLFDIDDNGYAVLNLINYDLMEFSFQNRPKFKENEKIIYNGFVSFYVDNGSMLYDVSKHKPINKESVSDFFSDIPIEKKELRQKLAEEETLKSSISAAPLRDGFIEYGSLPYSLVTWTTNYFCHVDSAAILLRYCFDHLSSDFLPSGATTNGNVQAYLCNNNILLNTTLSSAYVVGGASLYLGDMDGMEDYLSSMNISSWSAHCASYSFNSIKALINSGTPVVTESKNNLSPYVPDDVSHAYVVHGYMVGYDGVPRLYINNSLGSNNVSINASSIYYDSYPHGMWYIN